MSKIEANRWASWILHLFVGHDLQDGQDWTGLGGAQWRVGGERLF